MLNTLKSLKFTQTAEGMIKATVKTAHSGLVVTEQITTNRKGGEDLLRRFEDWLKPLKVAIRKAKN